MLLYISRNKKGNLLLHRNEPKKDINGNYINGINISMEPVGVNSLNIDPFPEIKFGMKPKLVELNLIEEYE